MVPLIPMPCSCGPVSRSLHAHFRAGSCRAKTKPPARAPDSCSTGVVPGRNRDDPDSDFVASARAGKHRDHRGHRHLPSLPMPCSCGLAEWVGTPHFPAGSCRVKTKPPARDRAKHGSSAGAMSGMTHSIVVSAGAVGEHGDQRGHRIVPHPPMVPMPAALCRDQVRTKE
jgi:hypothetical protein